MVEKTKEQTLKREDARETRKDVSLTLGSMACRSFSAAVKALDRSMCGMWPQPFCRWTQLFPSHLYPQRSAATEHPEEDNKKRRQVK